MKKPFKKIIFLIFLALIANVSVFAVSSEFKNTLTNVDLVKTSEDSYNINLYTSKKYNSPVKVIKKNDLSYYILLPETKNITPKVSNSTSDIRSMNTTMYSYAGVDINNGYTKIDINTTKPINFSVAVKNANQVAINTSTIAQNVKKEEKIQKKNSEIQKQDSINQDIKFSSEPDKIDNSANKITNDKKQTVQTPSKKEIVPVEQKTSAKESKDKKSVKLLPEKKKETVSSNKNVIRKEIKQEAKKEIKKEAIQQETIKAPIQKALEAKKTNTIKDKLEKITHEQQNSKAINAKKLKKIPTALAAAKVDMVEKNIASDNVIAQEDNTPIEQEEIVEENTINNEELQNETEQELTEEANDVIQENEPNTVVSKKIDFKEFFINVRDKIKSCLISAKSGFESGYSGLSDNLSEYNLTVLDLLFIIFAGIFSFVAVILIRTKPQNQPKLKSKSELLEKTEPSLVPKKETTEDETKEQEGQYFVFENNVKQTELTTPATLKEAKNFELVSYDPDIMSNDKLNESKNEEEDLDIIQKILKEDNFIDIQPTNEEVNDKDVDNEDSFIEVEAPQMAEENNVMENNTTDNNIVENTLLIEQEVATEIKTETSETTKITEEPVRQNENVTSPIGMEHVQKETVNYNSDEPQLLASYNISPEQGFMFIYYNNNVNLMGFIFDDVFALHNFKTPELANYNLQFKLVDKDEHACIYMVKTEAAKLLVKVSKTSMNTEIIL